MTYPWELTLRCRTCRRLYSLVSEKKIPADQCQRIVQQASKAHARVCKGEVEAKVIEQKEEGAQT